MDEHEEEYDSVEKEDGKYYIGTFSLNSSQNQDRNDKLIMAATISSKGFYKYSFTDVMEYLSEMTLFNNTDETLHIMKLDVLPDLTYSVVLKTHWIRLIQRTWKRILRQRISIMKDTRYICQRQLGRTRKIPGLRGML